MSVYPYSELNNSILTGEVGMGSDGFMDKGEVWTKTCGPWFMYLNHLPAGRARSQGGGEGACSRTPADQADRRGEGRMAAMPWFKHEQFIPRRRSRFGDGRKIDHRR